MKLDHEKLDVYRVALDFAAWAYTVCRTLKGLDRPTRDQLIRASQSIALNIAEGCGKIPMAERGRFFQIAGGSARECGAILDILDRCGVLDREAVRHGKEFLVRIVAMLTRMIERRNQVREGDVVYENGNGYVNENGNGYENGYGYGYEYGNGNEYGNENGHEYEYGNGNENGYGYENENVYVNERENDRTRTQRSGSRTRTRGHDET